MDDIVFTRDDLKNLHTMCNMGSALETVLEDIDYDPVKFKQYIRRLPTHFKYLYQMPLSELPLEMDNKSVQGLINFRFSISK